MIPETVPEYQNVYNEYRVAGPPGTGKTTWLGRQIDRAAEKYGKGRVLVASFTKAAAAELVSRDLKIDPTMVGTLHSHCYRSIGGGEIAETKISEWNQDHPGMQLSGGKRSSGALDDPFADEGGKTKCDEHLARIGVLRNQMIPESVWPASVKQFWSKWTEWKKECNLIDFNDMLETAYRDVSCAPGKPNVIFVDEVQDCTKIQLAIVRRWAIGIQKTILTGDGDQTIFRFIGATPKAFTEPPVPDKQKIVLSQSYRVPKAIHAVATKWIAKCSYREDYTYRPTEIEGSVERIAATYRHPERLLSVIDKHTTQGKKVLIIASCSYMVDPVISLLRKEGIPFSNPFRTSNGRWNPLGAKHGVSMRERILAYLSGEPLADNFKMWVPLLESKGLLKSGAKKQIEELPDNHKVPIYRLSDWFEDDETAWAMARGEAELLEKHCLSKHRGKIEYPLLIASKYGTEKLSEEPQVMVGTIHSVKGGEADVVVMFPDLSVSGMREWMAHGDPRDGVIRMFYVGMTRARETLIITQPSSSCYAQV